jgi:CheY-like chemotaxis protein
VDDERVIADTLSLILRGVGYETFTAYDGMLGLEAARRLEPDLVLSDVVMPKLDGVSMAMEIRDALPEIKLMLFSGQAGTSDLLHDAEANGFHFELLQKPMHPDELIRRVKMALLPSKLGHEANSLPC